MPQQEAGASGECGRRAPRKGGSTSLPLLTAVKEMQFDVV